jgi:hypothetical protein
VLERRAKLTPIIKELRSVRAQHAEAEAAYLHDRAVYENTSAGLATERASLEREASAVQEDALREEGRFHMLQMQLETLSVAAERAREEAAYERGEGRYMRDFRTVKDLYAQKLGQLETLAKELRKKQKDIRENSGSHAAQRARFVDLRRLLACKADVYRRDPSGGMHGLAGMMAGGAGGSSGMGGGRGGAGGVGDDLLDGYAGTLGGGGYGAGGRRRGRRRGGRGGGARQHGGRL